MRRRRAVTDFLRDNRRLFPLTGLLVLGVIGGIAVYLAIAKTAGTAEMGALLHVNAVAGGLKNGLRALGSACFPTALGVLLLFLLGLWSCGAPFVLAVPFVYGLGLGMTEAYYYALGGRGVLAVVTVILPNALLTAAVLIMAGAESLRLCLQISRRLLPAALTGAEEQEPDALWQVFRLYCLRFLLFSAAAVAVGVTDVLLRTVFAARLP